MATDKVIPEGQATVEKEIPPFLLPGFNPQSLSTIEFAEQKRDTLRAETMVNMAIGMTLVLTGDTRQIVITDDMIKQFAARYRVATSDTPDGVLLEVVEK